MPPSASSSSVPHSPERFARSTQILSKFSILHWHRALHAREQAATPHLTVLLHAAAAAAALCFVPGVEFLACTCVCVPIFLALRRRGVTNECTTFHAVAAVQVSVCVVLV